nr:hypothetical protein CJLB15_00056 [Campylobacter phage CJLB-15]
MEYVLLSYLLSSSESLSVVCIIHIKCHSPYMSLKYHQIWTSSSVKYFNCQ